jgi:diguanylate cyclase (GGDEF)-like protein
MAIPNILKHLVELTANVTNAFTVGLFGIDRERQHLVLREHISLSRSLKTGVKIPLGDEGPIATVAATGEPVVIDNFKPGSVDLKIYDKKENLKSFIALPIIHNQLDGVLVVASKEAYCFSTKLQKIIAGFADQMAWHLNQGKDLPAPPESAQPSVHKMNVFSRLIAESPNRKKVVDRLIQTSPALLKCDAMAVIWFDEKGEAGKIQGPKDFAQELSKMESIQGKSLGHSSEKNRSSFLHRAMQKQKPLLFSDKEKSEQFKSLATVPITQGEKLLGILVCGSRKGNGSTHPELDNLSLLASSQASIQTRKKNQPKSDPKIYLDPMTQLQNHRFLTDHYKFISQKIFKNRQPVFFLDASITNLQTILKEYGQETHDSLQKQMATGFTKVVPSLKYIFKYSDNSFLILLMNRQREEVDALESKLKNLFENKPIFVQGNPIRIQMEMGLSSYPVDGEQFLDLIRLCHSRSREQFNMSL